MDKFGNHCTKMIHFFPKSKMEVYEWTLLTNEHTETLQIPAMVVNLETKNWV
jgi:hypothetical protein